MKEAAGDKERNKAQACFNVEQNELNMEEININLHIFFEQNKLWNYISLKFPS